MILIDVTKNDAKVSYTEKLTSGTVGQKCQFNFSEEWNDLTKIAVCVCGNVVKDVIVDELNTIEIPWEVLVKHGKYLDIGVYGTDGNGERAIPTIYATVGAVCKGADPSGDESVKPTPTVWEQVLAFIKNVPYTIDAMGKAIFHGHSESASADEKGNTIHTHYTSVDDANNTFCNAIRGTSSGVGAVKMENVSPLPHNINLKTDVPTGFKSYGKNLTPYDVENWVISGNDALYPLDIPTCNVVITLWRSVINGTFDLRKYKPDGTYEGYERFYTTASGLKKSIQLPYQEGYTYKIKTTKSALEIIKDGTLDVWFQVEVGNATEYEEYKEPREGVVSVHPTTTLVADTPGVAIEATYNKDITEVVDELRNAIINLGGTL
jgi:hypothetical protein